MFMAGVDASTPLSEGPVLDAKKRAVFRRAPDNFRVKLLPPEKKGNSHIHGFLISPIGGNHSPTPNAHITSSGPYVVWRKWEDCLWFQERLEITYSRAAREKRSRLAAGKGVKKNGVYVHSDQAASWDSLPFGPAPSDIAWDIHQYIPKLPKKGTFFRTSQELVDHRHQSLQTMFRVLFQDDLPTLIREIKATPVFIDFFALWGRDIDLARKAQRKSDADRPRSFLSSSILSAFPISSQSPMSSPTTKGKAQAPARTPTASTRSDSSSEERESRLMVRGQEVRSRASSSTSRSSSSSPSTPVTMLRQLPSTSQQPVIVSPQTHIKYGYSPHVLSGDRGSFSLESLPEDCELASSSKPDLHAVWSRKRSESTTNVNRNARVYVPSPSRPLEPSELPPRTSSRYSRASVLSTRSSITLGTAAYLDELDVDYCLPSPTPGPERHLRASVSSLASLVTNSSVDAVIPRDERPLRLSSNNIRRQMEYEPQSEDDSQSEHQGDILDTYFQDMIAPFVQTPTGYPETPIVDDVMSRFSREQSTATFCSSSSYSDRRSSWATSISSGSTSSSGNPAMISIKAMHEDTIVLLRVSRCIVFDELRRKIHDKFMHTDKSTICDTFAIALVEQAPAEKKEGGRSRAGSFSSLGSGHLKGATLHFISSQDEWGDVAATHHGMLLLRIIGSRE